MLTKLGAQVRAVKLRSMEELVAFVQEADQQLAALKADEGLTVAQLDSWPKQRLDVLREAAGQFQELSYLQVKCQKWMLQQASPLTPLHHHVPITSSQLRKVDLHLWRLQRNTDSTVRSTSCFSHTFSVA